jgi:hypothetical protein
MQLQHTSRLDRADSEVKFVLCQILAWYTPVRTVIGREVIINSQSINPTRMRFKSFRLAFKRYGPKVKCVLGTRLLAYQFQYLLRFKTRDVKLVSYDSRTGPQLVELRN